MNIDLKAQIKGNFIIKLNGMMMNKIQSVINVVLAVSCLMLTSCKQVILVEPVLMNDVVEKNRIWGYIEKSFIDWSFGVWLTIDLIIALFVWLFGYKLLEWFRHKSMSAKVVIIFSFLSVLFVFGCMPNNLNNQKYGEWFALPVAMTIGSTIVVIWALIQRYRHSVVSQDEILKLPESFRRQRNLVLLAKVMIWVWSCGWTIYFVAIGLVKQPHVGAELLLRSAIASLGMFLVNIDSNIIDAIHEYDVLKGMIICTCFVAVICTTILIMSLVLSRLMAYLHIKHMKIKEDRNHLYLFFGLNDASKLLANDIHRKDLQSVIVFIENSLVGKTEQNDDKTDGWKNIVNMLTHQRKTFTDADENDRRALAIASCDIFSLEKDTTNIWGNMGLETVRCLLKKLSLVENAQLHVFFLSEDRDANVRATVILAKDELVNAPEYQTTIYCHARRNGVNKVIEDLGIEADKRTEIRIIDSSHLAMEYLKQKAENHPVNFVNVKSLQEDNPGAVSSEFTSLVVGFGETGQEAVEFLYEYGAFVNQYSTEHDSKRSPFYCHIVDSDMPKLEGHFITEIPGIKYKICDDNLKCRQNECEDSTERENSFIRLYSYDYRSIDFYTKVLDPILEKLNYVVVATGDDEQNMTVAIDILCYIRKKRDNLDHFCIYVRAYEKGPFKHLDEIAKHYNLRLSNDGQNPVKKIVLFGQNERIYTYELVVKDKFQEEGRHYYEEYRSLQIDPNNDEGTWEKRRNDIMTSKDGTKWERMSKIRRKEDQDRSNALHALTKVQLLEKAIGKEKAKDFAMRALNSRTGEQATIDYPQLHGPEKLLMLNLAITEHLRWNAAHEMEGYVNNANGHICDERTKQHNCLKPWQELDNESKNAGYPIDFKLLDFGVVETSFKLKYDSL